MGTRILIYGLNYRPEPIGVGRYTGELAEFLDRRGHKVSVITSPPHYPGWKVRGDYKNRVSHEVLNNVDVFRVPVFLTKGVGGLRRIMFILSFALMSCLPLLVYLVLNRPRVVLCVEPSLMSAPFALALCKILKIRIVLQVQDLEIEAALATGQIGGGWVRRLAEGFARRVRSSFDQVITISNRMSAELEACGVPAEKIVVVRNWIKPTLFSAQVTDFDYRAKFNIGDHQKVFLYSGNVGKKQGLHEFLAAAESLQDDFRYVFVISGEGPEKSVLERRFGSLQNVRFGDLVPEEELAPFLRFADVHIVCQLAGTGDFVLPSKIGPILASGGKILVASQDDTELHWFLGDRARFASIEDASSIVNGIRLSIEAPDLTYEARIQLAHTLSADVILPTFEDVLFGGALSIRGIEIPSPAGTQDLRSAPAQHAAGMTHPGQRARPWGRLSPANGSVDGTSDAA